MVLVITSPLVGVSVLQSVCLCVCLSVCLCFKNDASKLHKIFCTRCLWLWLGPCLMTVQCVMYFRFCGWRYFFTHAYVVYGEAYGWERFISAPLCIASHWLSFSHSPPFPQIDHRSSGDCLEGKRDNYQVCSVQYCVQQLYTVNCTHIWTELTILWIGFCLTGPISLCLDSFLCMYYFVSDCILHACVVL